MAWDDIQGHDAAKQYLRARIESGRVATGYLLAGPPGVGKRRLALEMAKALNCIASTERPCDRCPSCGQIARGTHPDVHVVAPSGASAQIKIEDIRHLLGRVALRPFNARVQVGLLDGVERLTEEAANALLKALEEPGPSTCFLLVTSRASDCLPTIVSRCQLVRFGPRPSGVGQEDAQRQFTARLAGDPPLVWAVAPLPETREGTAQFLDALMAWLRDVAVVSQDPSRITHAEHAAALRRQAAVVDVDRCVAAALELVALRDSLEQFVSPRLVASLAREKWLSLLERVP